MLYINEIKDTFLDFPDDENIAVIAFFEGCSWNCPGCQNKDLQKRNVNSMKSWQSVYRLIEERCTRNNTNKIVLSGGDPFYSKDIGTLRDMFALISTLEGDGFEVCVYTGSTIKNVINLYNKYGIDYEEIPIGLGNSVKVKKTFYSPTYIKCGTYNEGLLNPDMGKSNDYFILASSNQEFYKRKGDKDSKEYSAISSDGILRFQ